MKNPSILVAAADRLLGQSLTGQLLCHGFDVLGPATGSEGHQSLPGSPDLVIICHSAAGPEAEVQASEIKRRYGRVPLIWITGHDAEGPARSLPAGIADHLQFPFSCEELVACIRRNLAYPGRPSGGRPWDHPSRSSRQPLIGQSLAMRQVKRYLSAIATADSPVLITGETGTGKELAAEFIHRASPRHQKPLICINCAALPDTLLESELFGHEKGSFTGAVARRKGKFELASEGTVFLDEIGDMSLYAQAKILRVIEKKELYRLGGNTAVPVNMRLIAATNQELERNLAEGKFRRELYYRLNVARVQLPPLRERKGDIPLLLDYYIRQWNHHCGRQVKGFSAAALSRLIHYHWPGNVRELKNLVEAAFINLPPKPLDFIDLPEVFHRTLQETAGLPPHERDQLLSALYATNWNKSKAAQELTWSRMTLYRKMAKYNIVAPKPEL